MARPGPHKASCGGCMATATGPVACLCFLALVKKEEEIHVSFAVTPQTAKVTATVCHNA